MSRTSKSKNLTRSDEDLAQMVVRVGEAAKADAIICATETGAFVRHLQGLSDKVRLIAATTNRETYDTLIEAGLEAVRLPLRAINKYSQLRHIVSIAFRSARISLGDLVVCALGRNVYQEAGDIVVLTDVEPSIEFVGVSDLLKLTDGIRPTVLEITVEIACKIGRAARRGVRLGAIFMLGDFIKVLEGFKQLIPNPFQGHDDVSRRLTKPEIHTALVELSKLDGAFVVRGDGFIQTAGAFLATTDADISLSPGLELDTSPPLP
ncbi:MAG: hypothetical protein JSU72_08030 [Deltaproteobacteria bacterium]|nr:MAG: hypothetical protein JSU72_08030 [Deltaproteobacteria bacterium]